jgi:hypothetical protein
MVKAKQGLSTSYSQSAAYIWLLLSLTTSRDGAAARIENVRIHATATSTDFIIVLDSLWEPNLASWETGQKSISDD